MSQIHSKIFFSIIIPAHNEAGYVKRTLKSMRELRFQKDKFEVIVVENGSTDKTFEIASKFQVKGIKVYKLKTRGVSNARNFGASMASKKSNWLIFLDADTILKKNFLTELDNFLSKSNKQYAIGTTDIWPIKKKKSFLIWFRFYNFLHKWFKSSFCIQIIRKDVFAKTKYDVSLDFSEDLKIIREALKYGMFFFLESKQVETSTRRIEEVGLFKLPFKWLVESILPRKIKEKKKYEVIRT